MTEIPITAKEYLYSERFGNERSLFDLLALGEQKTPPETKYIQQALVQKYDRNVYPFADGAIDEIVTIIAEKFPHSLEAWASGTIKALSATPAPDHSEFGFLKELRPIFEKAEGYEQITELLWWL